MWTTQGRDKQDKRQGAIGKGKGKGKGKGRGKGKGKGKGRRLGRT